MIPQLHRRQIFTRVWGRDALDRNQAYLHRLPARLMPFMVVKVSAVCADISR